MPADVRCSSPLAWDTAYAAPTDPSRASPPPQAVKPTTAIDSAHAIDWTTRSDTREIAPVREAGARKPVWPSSLTPARARPKALSNGACTPRRTHTAGTLAAGSAGKLGRIRRRGPGPAVRYARFLGARPGKMLRHSISKRQMLSAPIELRRIDEHARSSCLSALVRFVSCGLRGGNRYGPAGSPPPFMVVSEERIARSWSRAVSRSSSASS